MLQKICFFTVVAGPLVSPSTRAFGGIMLVMRNRTDGQLGMVLRGCNGKGGEGIQDLFNDRTGVSQGDGVRFPPKVHEGQ